jgi:hypothetical protein
MHSDEIIKLRVTDEEFAEVIHKQTVDVLEEVKDACKIIIVDCQSKLAIAQEKYTNFGISTKEDWWESCQAAMKIREKHIAMIASVLDDRLVEEPVLC